MKVGQGQSEAGNLNKIYYVDYYYYELAVHSVSLY